MIYFLLTCISFMCNTKHFIVDINLSFGCDIIFLVVVFSVSPNLGVQHNFYMKYFFVDRLSFIVQHVTYNEVFQKEQN